MAAPKDQHTRIAEEMLRRILRVAELLAPYADEEQPADPPPPDDRPAETLSENTRPDFCGIVRLSLRLHG
jgi:hypothetical protein